MLCCTHCCLPLSPRGLQGIKKVFSKGDIFLGAKGKIKQGVQMRFLSRLGSEFRLESETYYVISGCRCMNHTSSQCDLCAIYVWYRASTVCHSAGWKSIYEWFKIMPSVVFYSICNIMSVLIALQRNLSGSSRRWLRSQNCCISGLFWYFELGWMLKSLVSWESKKLMLTFPGSLGGKLLHLLLLHTVSAQVAADVLWTQNVSQTRNPGQWL